MVYTDRCGLDLQAVTTPTNQMVGNPSETKFGRRHHAAITGPVFRG